MKILQLSLTDLKGGAGRAAYRLHRGWIQKGVDSRMLVQSRYSEEPSVEAADSGSRFWRFYNQVRPLVNKAVQRLQKTTNTVFHSANFLPSRLHKRINNSDADIVHLHWVGAEMISVKEISKIDKPLVWTFHDMWAFCGSEHYDDLQSPGRYKTGYYRNNRPPNHVGIDIDRWTWNRKRKSWKDKVFFIVTPSRWLADCAAESALFRNQMIKTIPNGLDLDVYKPIDKEYAREKLNIFDQNKIKYILFGAMSATSDERKGYKELSKALDYLGNKYDKKHFRLIIFGSEGHNNNPDFGLPVTYLGKLEKDETLALAYSAADVMVVPSLQDNLPNTAVEAIACGTPIAAYNIGGLPDIIDHKENGYLACPYDHRELSDGIAWILREDDRLQQLKETARKKVLDRFDIKKVVKQYYELYDKILASHD